MIKKSKKRHGMSIMNLFISIFFTFVYESGIYLLSICVYVIVGYPQLISFRSFHSSTVGHFEGKTSYLLIIHYEFHWFRLTFSRNKRPIKLDVLTAFDKRIKHHLHVRELNCSALF